MVKEKSATEFGQHVVGMSGDMQWTRDEFEELFDMVARPENWKLPIDATVTMDSDRDILGMVEAVKFFAGCVPTVGVVFGAVPGGGIRYRVQAVGYYEAGGA